MPLVPRVESIEQAIAISGFTNSGRETGYIDLSVQVPKESLVLGWKGLITTRFTGGSAGRTTLSVGTPATPEAYGGAQAVESGASSVRGDNGGGFQTLAQNIRVTVADRLDFDNVSGGAVTITVYYLRTVA